MERRERHTSARAVNKERESVFIEIIEIIGVITEQPELGLLDWSGQAVPKQYLWPSPGE